MTSPPPGTGFRPVSARAPFGYLPGLDGLRALSVLAVVAYHLEASWAPGGFLGVEVFFVVSGYLITALLLSERDASGTIDRVEFWRRRARRLLPAVVVVIAATVGWAVVAGAPGDVARFRGDALASLLYVQNWWAIFADQPYFVSFGRPSPLRHLWSLAIEEQFYLLWPLVLPAVVRVAGRRRAAWLFLGGAIVSAATMAALADVAAPERAYFGTDARLSGILGGAVLAFLWQPSRAPLHITPGARRALTAAGVLALVSLAAMTHTVSEYEPSTFPWAFVSVDVATVIAIVTATHPASPLSSWLGAGPLQALGRRSYSIYLWHWPVLVYTRPGVDWGLEGAGALIARLALIAVLSEASYRLVEQPFRTGRAQAAIAAALAPSRSDAARFATVAGVTVVLAAVMIAAVEDEVSDPVETAVIATIDTTPGATAPPPTALTIPTTTTTTAAPLAPTTATSAPPAEVAAPTTATSAPSTTSSAPPPPGAATGPPPTAAANESSGPDVTVIGESVTLGGARHLQEYYGERVQIDASEGRHFEEGVELIEWLAAHDRLTPTVVVHLGNNGIAPPGALDRVVAAVGPDRRLVLVSVHVPRRWEDQVNGEIWRVVQENPRSRVSLADWHRLASEEEGLLIDDGVHLSAEGQRRYRDLLVGFAP